MTRFGVLQILAEKGAPRFGLFRVLLHVAMNH